MRKSTHKRNDILTNAEKKMKNIEIPDTIDFYNTIREYCDIDRNIAFIRDAYDGSDYTENAFLNGYIFKYSDKDYIIDYLNCRYNTQCVNGYFCENLGWKETDFENII